MASTFDDLKDTPADSLAQLRTILEKRLSEIETESRTAVAEMREERLHLANILAKFEADTKIILDTMRDQREEILDILKRTP